MISDIGTSGSKVKQRVTEGRLAVAGVALPEGETVSRTQGGVVIRQGKRRRVAVAARTPALGQKQRLRSRNATSHHIADGHTDCAGLRARLVTGYSRHHQRKDFGPVRRAHSRRFGGGYERGHGDAGHVYNQSGWLLSGAPSDA